jgi:hydroxymethylpyrimidine pyrophosphatase-like HAD family hydrolase/nucleoside-triphosphatase THEP1
MERLIPDAGELAPTASSRQESRRGRIVLLSGDPGVGKTHTCLKVTEVLRHKSLRVAGLLSESRRLSSGRIVQTVLNLRTGERRRLAEYVGADEGEPIGSGVAGRFSWQFVSESVRWGRHELQRCASAGADLLVIDQIGPLELVAGSGWANAVDVLLAARFDMALVVVNPLVLEEMQVRIGGMGATSVDVNDATRDLLPEYLVALGGWSSMPSRPLFAGSGPRCLVADLDGTLLDATGNPTSGVAAGLREIAAAGVTFAVCTGRPTEQALAAVRSLGADCKYVIAFGGAETSDMASGQVLRRVVMSGEARAMVLAISRSLRLEVTVHESSEGTLRLVLTGSARRIERAAHSVEEAVGDAVCWLRPAAGVLAVQSLAATKQTALASLAGHIGVARSMIAYLGDAADDAPALRWAGLGIAVASDAGEAVAAADAVAPRLLVPEMLVRLALARRLRSA